MRTRLLALLLVAATAVVAVPAVVAPSVVAGAATRAGGGCGKAATPGVTTEQLTVDGATRDYLLSIPDSYDPSTRAPLILNFHGLGSNKEQQALYSGMNQKAGAEGYVVITPDGTGTDLRHWAFPPLPGSATDVDFVKAMLATTTRTLCIDPKRVYATGMSNGAIFSTALACALPGRFAAIAPVAGRERDQGVRRRHAAHVGARVPRHRRPDRPVRRWARTSPAPTRSTRRRAAPASPRRSRSTTRWRAGRPSTAAARRRPPPREAGGIEHVVYPDCPAGGTVELYRVVDGGHTWPGAFPINAAASARRPRRSTPPP